MLVQGLVVERGVEDQSIQAAVVAVLLELAKQLIGSFYIRCHSAGRPQSVDACGQFKNSNLLFPFPPSYRQHKICLFRVLLKLFILRTLRLNLGLDREWLNFYW